MPICPRIGRPTTFSAWDKMMATDGNTATYMQYAYARNRNIFHKGEVDAQPFRTEPPLPTLDHPSERRWPCNCCALRRRCWRLRRIIGPARLPRYLWDVAKSYSGFFQNCPVLKARRPRCAKSAAALRPDGAGDSMRPGPARHRHG